MASHLLESLTDVVNILKDAGMHATIDPREITPPCAWVTLHDVQGEYLCGDPRIRADVCLIVGDFGTPIALDQLGELLDTALSVLSIAEDTTVRPVTLTPPGIAPIPALVITTD